MSRRRNGLLITESTKDFARRRKGLTEQIRPMGPVEDEYLDDFAYNRWETDRFRRIAAALLNNALVKALENLLRQLLRDDDFETSLELDDATEDLDAAEDFDTAEDLARRYFHDGEVKAYVSELLRKSGLDETAIEAEAFRLCAADLEAVHRLMAFKQARGDRDLCLLGEIRQGSLRFLQATPKPAVEEPALEAPALEAPALEAPALEAPALEAPALEAPAREAPAREAPALEEPALEDGVPRLIARYRRSG
jgi:hypothetical protein